MSNLHSMPVGAVSPAQGNAPIYSDSVNNSYRCLTTRAAAVSCCDINDCPAGRKRWSARQAKFAKA